MPGGGSSTGNPVVDSILAQAQAQADAELARKANAIKAQQAAAAAAAERDRNALQGLAKANIELLAPIPGRIADIRNQAGSAIAGYGEGYSKGTEATINQGQEQTAKIVGAAGQPAAPTVDASAVQRAMYATNGAIPATEQSEIGAASGMAAAGEPGVVARASQEDIMQRMAEAAATDEDYRRQLLALNEERPGLVQDAVDRLNKIKQQDFENAMAQREMLLRERAELVQEASLRARTAQQRRQYALQLKQLDAQLKSLNERIRHDQVSEGIQQQNADTSQQNANTKAQNDKKKQNTSAAAAKAVTLRGNPITAPAMVRKPNGKMGPPAGKYKGRAGAKGLFPDGTTNDPNRAARDGMSFNQAQAYLVQNYSLSRAEARKILISIGWKPGK